MGKILKKTQRSVNLLQIYVAEVYVPLKYEIIPSFIKVKMKSRNMGVILATRFILLNI